MATGAAIAAVAGTAYSIYASERSRKQQKKEARKAREAEERRRQEEQARYEQAREDWEGALERSRAQYKSDVAKSDELKKYYSDVAADPMSTSIWKQFSEQVSGQYEGAKERIATAMASRGGLRGGVSEEALGQLETAKTETLANTLSQIIAEAKAQYAAVPTPQWTEPTFQGIGTPVPQWESLYFAPQAFQPPDLSAFGAIAGSEWGKETDEWIKGLFQKGGTLKEPAPYDWESTILESPDYQMNYSW